MAAYEIFILDVKTQTENEGMEKRFLMQMKMK